METLETSVSLSLFSFSLVYHKYRVGELREPEPVTTPNPGVDQSKDLSDFSGITLVKVEEIRGIFHKESVSLP